MTATDTDAPPIDSPALAPIPNTWGDTDLIGATLEVKGTGAGLDKSIDIPPVQVVPGHHVDVVMRCRLEQHRVKYLNDRGTEGVWVNGLVAEYATIVGADEVAGEALDRVEKAVAARKQRKEDGVDERQLTLGDGVRGGEPAAVGDVLGDVTAMIDGADARNDRLAELEAWDTPDLKERASEIDVPGRSKMTVAELRDAIVDHELEHGLLDDEAGEGGADA